MGLWSILADDNFVKTNHVFHSFQHFQNFDLTYRSNGKLESISKQKSAIIHRKNNDIIKYSRLEKICIVDTYSLIFWLHSNSFQSNCGGFSGLLLFCFLGSPYLPNIIKKKSSLNYHFSCRMCHEVEFHIFFYIPISTGSNLLYFIESL